MIERLNEVERRLNGLMQALQAAEGRLAAVEQQTWQRAGFPATWPFGSYPLRKAITGVSGIGAATATDEPTGATVTLLVWDSSTETWETTSDDVTAYNPSTAGAVPGSTLITIAWVDNKMWEVILEPC